MEKVRIVPVYVIRTVVAKVEEVWNTVGGTKVGDDTILEKEFQGWFIRFSGSRESLFFGSTAPEFKVGDEVEIRIRNVTTSVPRS